MADTIESLTKRVELLEKLVKLKILGNDTSTNYGLPAQTILYGLQQVGSLSLTKNGVRTTINNDIDPDFGGTVSLESEDTTIPHGDKSAVTPNAFIVVAWDGAAYQTIAFIADGGSGFGDIGLANVGSANAITIEASTPQIQVTDGTHTSVLLPNGLIVGNNTGFTGSITSGGHTATFINGICTNIT